MEKKRQLFDVAGQQQVFFRLNFRVKDLVDMLLLIQLRKINIEEFKKIIKKFLKQERSISYLNFLNRLL